MVTAMECRSSVLRRSLCEIAKQCVTREGSISATPGLASLRIGNFSSNRIASGLTTTRSSALTLYAS